MICIVHKKELQMTQSTYLQLFHEAAHCQDHHQVHYQVHHQVHRQVDLSKLLIISIVMICLVNKKELQMTQFTYLQLFYEEIYCLEHHQAHCQIHHQIHRQIDLNGLLIISISMVCIVHKKELQLTQSTYLQ